VGAGLVVNVTGEDLENVTKAIETGPGLLALEEDLGIASVDTMFGRAGIFDDDVDGAVEEENEVVLSGGRDARVCRRL